jgi:hypothetical protein
LTKEWTLVKQVKVIVESFAWHHFLIEKEENKAMEKEEESGA